DGRARRPPRARPRAGDLPRGSCPAAADGCLERHGVHAALPARRGGDVPRGRLHGAAGRPGPAAPVGGLTPARSAVVTAGVGRGAAGFVAPVAPLPGGDVRRVLAVL